MILQQLDPRIAAEHHDPERSLEAALCAEIAERLLEWAETTSRARAMGFITKLSAIYQSGTHGRAAVWMILRLLKGDLTEITRSYEEIGHERGRTKQAVQQEIEHVIALLDDHFPHLSAAMKQLRNITATIK